MSDRIQAHMFVAGRVQGVFFRVLARERANELGLSGWARNLPDGRVETVFEGPHDAVQEMIDWCAEGPPYAEVTGTEWVLGEPEGLDGFSIS